MKKDTFSGGETCSGRGPGPCGTCMGEDEERQESNPPEAFREEVAGTEETVPEGREREETEKKGEKGNGGAWKWVVALLLAAGLVAGRMWWKVRSGAWAGGENGSRQKAIGLDGLSLEDVRWAVEEEEEWRAAVRKQCQQTDEGGEEDSGWP